MNKNITVISILALFLITACSLSTGLGFRTVKGSGDIVIETRRVDDFDRVDVCCGMELYLIQDGKEFLQIEADDNFMAEIETRVVNGKLDIYFRATSGVSYHPTQPVRLILSFAEISGVSISGGGLVYTDSISSDIFELNLSGGSTADFGKLEVDDLRFQVSGGGDIHIDSAEAQDIALNLSGASDAWIEYLTADALRLDSSGGGVTTISGAITKAIVEVSGGGNFNGGDLQTGEMVITCSGGGNAKVWVVEQLDADLSGGSSLAYYGEPKVINQETSGGSSIDSLGAR